MVIGTLTPAVAASLIDAVSTLWQIKNPAPTHDNFQQYYVRTEFLPFYTKPQKTAFATKQYKLHEEFSSADKRFVIDMGKILKNKPVPSL